MSFYVERDGVRIQGNPPHRGVKLGRKLNSALAKPATSACRNTHGLFAGERCTIILIARDAGRWAPFLLRSLHLEASRQAGAGTCTYCRGDVQCVQPIRTSGISCPA
eukprot:jgi/Botrbrau1/22244/Bobra.0138s0006.1